MIKGISGGFQDASATIQSVADANLTVRVSKSEGVNHGDSFDYIAISNNSDANDGMQKDDKILSEDDVSEISDALNKLMEKENNDIKFDYCKELDQLTMQVVDRKTKEVIKQFPPERMLEVLKGIREWVGILLDKKV